MTGLLMSPLERTTERAPRNSFSTPQEPMLWDLKSRVQTDVFGQQM